LELVNQEITQKFKTVLCIDENGTQIGTIPANAALAKAGERGLDLVCVAPKVNPPVCKFLDYGKYKFEQRKKEKEIKKNSIKVETSEIQLTYTIADHDLQTKANTCKRLINEKGNMVRVVLRLRGREVNMSNLAKEKVKKFILLCDEFAQIKKDIFMEGRDIKVILEKKKQ